MTTLAPTTQTAVRGPGFLSQVSAEWTKLRSVRAFYVQIALALVLSIGLSSLICLAISSRWDSFGLQEKATFNPVTTSLFGTIFGGIVLSITGVTLVSSEYSSGMIRLTMAVTPSRLRVLFAKAAVVAGATWVVGLVVIFGSFLAGQAVLGSHAGVPTGSLADSGTRSDLLGAWLTTPLFPLIGAALAAILRSTASAITATLALIFVPGILGGLLPEWWQQHLLAYLPGNARDSLFAGDRNAVTYIEPVVAVITVLAWIVVFFGVSSLLVKRRDV